MVQVLFATLDLQAWVVKLVLQVAWVLAFVLVISAMLLVISENFPRAMLLYVSTYNSGIGQFLDLQFMYLQVIEWFVRFLLPLYNSIVWFIRQIILQVFLPLLGSQTAFASIPELLHNLALTVSAFTVSLASYTKNILFCASGVDYRGASRLTERHMLHVLGNNATQSLPLRAIVNAKQHQTAVLLHALANCATRLHAKQPLIGLVHVQKASWQCIC